MLEITMTQNVYCLNSRLIRLLGKKESGFNYPAPDISKDIFLFPSQGVAGKPGPRGQRGPTVRIPTTNDENDRWK